MDPVQTPRARDPGGGLDFGPVTVASDSKGDRRGGSVPHARRLSRPRRFLQPLASTPPPATLSSNNRRYTPCSRPPHSFSSSPPRSLRPRRSRLTRASCSSRVRVCSSEPSALTSHFELAQLVATPASAGPRATPTARPSRSRRALAAREFDGYTFLTCAPLTPPIATSCGRSRTSRSRSSAASAWT
jgi:hypothetical protein